MRSRLTFRPAGLIAVLALLAAPPTASADVFTWQCKLVDAGQDADGIYDFQFSLWDTGTVGTQLGSTLVVDDVTITDGLVTVDLDFTDPAAFDGNDRWIEVAVKADADGSYTTLAPRQPVHPAPYAMHALNVSPSAVPFNFNGANAVFTGGNVSIGTTNPLRKLWVEDASTSAYIGVKSPMRTGVLFGSNSADTDGGIIFNHPSNPRGLDFRTSGNTTHMSIDDAGNVGIGMTTPDSELTIAGAGDGQKLLGFAEGATSGFYFESGFAGSDGDNFMSFSTSIGGLGDIMTWKGDGNVGIGTTTPLAPLDVRGSSSWPVRITSPLNPGINMKQDGAASSWSIYHDGSTDNLAFRDSTSGVTRMAITGDTGNVGIGTTNPLRKLWVEDASTSAYIGVKSPMRTGVLFGSNSADTDGGIIFNHPSNPRGLDFRTSGNTTHMSIDDSGNVGIGTLNPEGLSVTTEATDNAFGFWAPAEIGVHAGTILAGTSAAVAISGSSTFGGRIYFTEADGPMRATLGYIPSTQMLELDFASGLSVPVLEIRGGADIVEGFDTTEDMELEPGTVVSIDPNTPGALMRSTDAYDFKVAGVVSGAGGVQAGMHLGQDGVLDGDTKVAMTGRVYVKCTTENGPIRPGDRLTTASLAGHAMKATDSTRSDGAVIGKAMSSLDEDTGLVLVLVNLQ